MTKSLSWACFALAVLLLGTCCDDDAPTGPEEDPNLYEGCCDTEPAQHNITGTKIYIPNAFTPNADGSNDDFSIFANREVPENFIFLSLQISDRLGVEIANIATPRPGDPSASWNGRLQNGITYEGLFNYSLTIEDTLGVEHTLMGQACAIPCRQDSLGNYPAIDIAEPVNCAFGLSHDGDGGYDPNLDSGEYLECL